VFCDVDELEVLWDVRVEQADEITNLIVFHLNFNLNLKNEVLFRRPF
jgi:hypothetical protein